MPVPIIAMFSCAIAGIAMLLATLVLALLMWTDPVVVLQSYTRWSIILFWPTIGYFMYRDLNDH